MTRTSSEDAGASEVAALRGTGERRAHRGGVRSSVRRWAARVGAAVVVIWGAATAAFLAQLAQPGDRATSILNLRSGQVQERTAGEVAPINAEYGFDAPVSRQYLDYLGRLLHGDLGTSYQQHRPVLDVVVEQVGPTVSLSVTALVLAWLIMVGWVTLTAGRSPRVSAFGAGVEAFLASLPHYWLGVVLVLGLALGLGWFPVVGGSGVHGLVLPALTLALPLVGFLGQTTRAEFERVLAQPFVLSARMRGASETAVRLRHVLRHAALAPLTLTGWALGATLSSAVVVESVFTRRGIGSTLVTAVESQDLPIVTGIVVLVALVYVVINLVLDALYPLIDPRTA